MEARDSGSQVVWIHIYFLKHVAVGILRNDVNRFTPSPNILKIVFDRVD